MVDYTNWRSKGMCLDAKNPDIFFPSKGRPAHNPEYLTYCDSCPVKAICLIFGVANNESGVWGGFTESERLALPKNLKNQMKTQAENFGILEDRPVLVVTRTQVVELVEVVELELEENPLDHQVEVHTLSQSFDVSLQSFPQLEYKPLPSLEIQAIPELSFLIELPSLAQLLEGAPHPKSLQ